MLKKAIKFDVIFKLKLLYLQREKTAIFRVNSYRKH